MRHVFVSGCYDPLHAGHLQFFRDARALGTYLTVCFASADVLWAHKQRHPSLPDTHRGAILKSLKGVDQVVRGEGRTPGLDFEELFVRLRPDILAVTEDDRYADLKRELCARVDAEYRVLPKTPPLAEPLSSTEIMRRIHIQPEILLRVEKTNAR